MLTPDDLAGAFQVLVDQRIDVGIVLQTSMLVTERREVAHLAAVKHLPMVYGYREHVVDGGLISYGVDLRFAAKSLDEEKEAARRLNKAALDIVVFVPLGGFYQYQAWRRSVSGIVKGPLPFFWGVSKTA